MITRRSLLSGGAAATLAVALGSATRPARRSAAQAGTPAPSSPIPVGAGDPGSLPGMLAHAPDMLAGSGPATVHLATYANVAAQIASVGVATPRTADDPSLRSWVRAASNLQIAGLFAQHGLQPEWRQLFGFDLLQIDQSLEVGEPPSTITFLRGRFSPDEIRTALTKSGYQPVDAAGATVLSLHADPEIHMDSPVSQLALASMNNVALLADGTLVSCGALAILRAALAAAAGSAPSLAQQFLVAALLVALPDNLASAVLVSGAALGGADPAAFLLGESSGQTSDQIATAIATQIAEITRMPPVLLALIGSTLGGPLPRLNPDATPEPAPAGQPIARCLIALLMADHAAATTAAAVVDDRLGHLVSLVTRRPYAEDFPQHKVSVAPDSPVVLVDLLPGPGRSTRVIFSMLNRRDLLFVAW